MKKLDKKIDTNQAFVAICATLACALWGSAYPAVKIGYESFQIDGGDFSSQILFAGYRFTLAGVLTFILGSIMEKRILLPKKQVIPELLGLGIVQTTIQYIFFYIGLSNTTGVKGSIINTSNSFLVILLAHFFIKKEKLSSRKILGCILGFVGVLIINFRISEIDTNFSIRGEGFLILAALAYATASIMTKFISKKDTTMVITAVQLLFGGMVLIVTGKILGGHIENFHIFNIGLLVYMALLSTVAFSLWTMLLKYNPVSKVAIYGFMIPVFGVLLSGVFLGEDAFTIRNIIALVFVSAGIIVVNAKKS